MLFWGSASVFCMQSHSFVGLLRTLINSIACSTCYCCSAIYLYSYIALYQGLLRVWLCKSLTMHQNSCFIYSARPYLNTTKKRQGARPSMNLIGYCADLLVDIVSRIKFNTARPDCTGDDNSRSRLGRSCRLSVWFCQDLSDQETFHPPSKLLKLNCHMPTHHTAWLHGLTTETQLSYTDPIQVVAG